MRPHLEEITFPARPVASGNGAVIKGNSAVAVGNGTVAGSRMRAVTTPIISDNEGVRGSEGEEEEEVFYVKT